MNDKIKQLVELSNEYPELETITMTFYEVCCEEWGYWKGNISKVEKGFYYHDEERIYLGRDEILEELENREYEIGSETMFELLQSEGKIKEAIIVYIDV